MGVRMKTPPKDWDDDERASTLLAPFRKKESNPLGYESKMSFWKNLIENCCFESDCCTFTLDNLENAFKNKERRPQCLKEVLENLYREQEIAYLQCFLAEQPSANGSKRWMTWAIQSFVKAPAVWSVNRLKESLVSPSEVDFTQAFVHMPVVKKQAETILRDMDEDLKGTLIRYEELADVCAAFKKFNECLNVIVHWLELQGHVSTIEVENEKLIRFSKNDKFESITDLERTTFLLEKNEKLLLNSIENLENKKQALVSDAQGYLKKNMRPMAKSCLRKKKEIEKQIAQKCSALDNIQTILTRIRNMESDSKVFSSYKDSLSMIKELMSKNDLSEETVGNTMMQLQEVLEVHDEIQNSLAEPASTLIPNSDEDYEKELAELLADDNLTSESYDFGFPEPPTTTPIASPIKPQKEDKAKLPAC
ncbi:charged multivesicular body protein 7 [Nilaparvata lugens]|uniref:charged multivesicular body protein 7 n=1 Tax=Nilaparvata lugens TaxID=108931 RepID=UPI00193DDA0B|nr:charged multivesicular body protein 7 [Nilaparvata lugens]